MSVELRGCALVSAQLYLANAVEFGKFYLRPLLSLQDNNGPTALSHLKNISFCNHFIIVQLFLFLGDECKSVFFFFISDWPTFFLIQVLLIMWFCVTHGHF